MKQLRKKGRERRYTRNDTKRLAEVKVYESGEEREKQKVRTEVETRKQKKGKETGDRRRGCRKPIKKERLKNRKERNQDTSGGF